MAMFDNFLGITDSDDQRVPDEVSVGPDDLDRHSPGLTVFVDPPLGWPVDDDDRELGGEG